MIKVLFVNNPARQCGVHEYGKATAEALATSPRLSVQYLELPEAADPAAFADSLGGRAADVVIYNWHPITMGWLSDDVFAAARLAHPRVKHLSLAHDHLPPFRLLDGAIHIDPTVPDLGREYTIGRLLPPFTPTAVPGPNVIGSFGLGGTHKGFHRVVDRVNTEFETATLRLHIPFSSYGDPEGLVARGLGEACRERAKSGITVEVSHDYKSQRELLEWLSQNTVNCFFYDHLDGAGPSSALDLALAARRPVALTRSHMFRHVIRRCPSTLIGRHSLREIIDAGFAPLEGLYREWSRDAFVARYEQILEQVVSPPRYDLRSNRVLTAGDREALRPSVAELQRLCPDIMGRKIPQAVFQNAYIFEQVKRFAWRSDDMMVIGGFEDPIGPSLRRLGYRVEITDPNLDGKDAAAVWRECILSGRRFDVIICCSVIEHAADDVNFLRMLCQLLKPQGVALLTTDFQNGWRPGCPAPGPDDRMYSVERLREVASQFPVATLLDPPTWEPLEPYFELNGIRYGFCSLAFRRPLRLPPAEEARLTPLIPPGEWPTPAAEPAAPSAWARSLRRITSGVRRVPKSVDRLLRLFR